MSKEELEKIREIPIHTFINIKNVGRKQMIKCPFHGEKTPSCVIYPDNSFHCFGCGAHGKGAIDFFVKMGYTFSETVNQLKGYL